MSFDLWVALIFVAMVWYWNGYQQGKTAGTRRLLVADTPRVKPKEEMVVRSTSVTMKIVHPCPIPEADADALRDKFKERIQDFLADLLSQHEPVDPRTVLKNEDSYGTYHLQFKYDTKPLRFVEK